MTKLFFINDAVIISFFAFWRIFLDFFVKVDTMPGFLFLEKSEHMKKGAVQWFAWWSLAIIGIFYPFSWSFAGQTIDGVYYNDAGVAGEPSSPSGTTYSDPSGG